MVKAAMALKVEHGMFRAEGDPGEKMVKTELITVPARLAYRTQWKAEMVQHMGEGEVDIPVVVRPTLHILHEVDMARFVSYGGLVERSRRLIQITYKY
jgi:hypothetical protein